MFNTRSIVRDVVSAGLNGERWHSALGIDSARCESPANLGDDMTNESNARPSRDASRVRAGPTDLALDNLENVIIERPESNEFHLHVFHHGRFWRDMEWQSGGDCAFDSEDTVAIAIVAPSADGNVSDREGES